MEDKSAQRKHPILLFDVMGTLIYDPFYREVPAFFGTSLKELIAVKHPRAWVQYEEGAIDEAELERIFFADGRAYDHEGMKAAMREAYAWLPGMEELLGDLRRAGFESHALSNYPEWWRMIEDKLALSRFLQWSFVSCDLGVRKPDPRAYTIPVERLGVAAEQCLFIDDRQENVDAAQAVGLGGILFESRDQLAVALRERGLTWGA